MSNKLLQSWDNLNYLEKYKRIKILKMRHNEIFIKIKINTKKLM